MAEAGAVHSTETDIVIFEEGNVFFSNAQTVM